MKAVDGCAERQVEGLSLALLKGGNILQGLLLFPQQILAWEFYGKRYDCGNKLGYLQATVEYALKHPELKDDFCEYLQSLLADGSFCPPAR